ncbi:F-box protein [Striga asiatica]|uniref:F-box protein n=1 Tax=Striga asiatica TaxID=4170 RepID=A0A5A7NXZ6_STRAF|nr:F-box protein [Striga asiatica]
MGVLSTNFLGNAKSKLRYLSSTLYSTASHVKSQAHVPRGFAVDPNNNDGKIRFLFMYFVKNIRYSSVISAETSWKVDELRSKKFVRFTAKSSKPPPEVLEYDIAASIDDLMLVWSWARLRRRRNDILWNPTNDEIKLISLPPDFDPFFVDLLVGLGFDPAKPHGYKMVKILIDHCEFKAPPEFRAALYSLENDSWRKIAYPYQEQGIPTARASIRVGGSYYWGLSSMPRSIISFDFASEKFSPSPIPFPGKIRYETADYLLVEFDGSLAILLLTNVSNNAQEPYSTFEIWVWNDESWSLKSEFKIPVAIDHVVGLFGNNKLFVQDITGKVLLFDVAEPRLVDITGICADSKAVWILPYVESPVPLNASE